MTLEKLNQMRRNIIALKKLQARIEEKKRKAQAVSQNISGMPSAKCSHSGKENIILSYIDDEKALEKMCEEMTQAYSKAISYIMNIEDPAIRLIFHYRFICGYSWVKTAMELGGGNTDDSVRKRVKKYLQKN